uniref:H15 domain-containing protein n=1 Tax=Heterorhabditis bacteriophora TaxID=37862 RepID=A0A1I7XML2_HETBA
METATNINMEGMLDAKKVDVKDRKLDAGGKKILDEHNPVSHPHHPTYITMIKNKGASKTAILKYIAQHYQLGENLPKARHFIMFITLQNDINAHLRTALRKGIELGEIEQTKGHGASGSFKIGAAHNTVKKNVGSVKKNASVKKVEKPTKMEAEKGEMKSTSKQRKAKRVAIDKVAKITKKTPTKRTMKKPKIHKKRVSTKKKAPRAKRAAQV